MRFLIVIWMLLPFGMLAWHAGPGRDLLWQDRAGFEIRQATGYAASGSWKQAAAAYQAARQQLPPTATALRRRLKFAQAQALAQDGQQETSRQMLQEMLDEMESDPATDPDSRDQVRHELATASYYNAWRMRLEGAADDDWQPLAHHARQQFRTLADEASRQAIRENNIHGAEAQRRSPIFRRNLEATIKLQSMHPLALLKKNLPEIYARDLAAQPPTAKNSSAGAIIHPPPDTHI
ncbi:MAG: hypothetical protein GTO62_13615, partial [Planctomycetales bacterium]|nr:hypothetical protein [Planctomycetales bacterium]NIP70271.1 hypothetical protein [Planctomycetales bacterium]